MTDGHMEWVVPVVTVVGTTRVELKIFVEDGDVVVFGPQSPYIVPADSVPVFTEALTQAHRVASGMGWQL